MISPSIHGTEGNHFVSVHSIVNKLSISAFRNGPTLLSDTRNALPKSFAYVLWCHCLSFERKYTHCVFPFPILVQITVIMFYTHLEFFQLRWHSDRLLLLHCLSVVITLIADPCIHYRYIFVLYVFSYYINHIRYFLFKKILITTTSNSSIQNCVIF